MNRKALGMISKAIATAIKVPEIGRVKNVPQLP